MSHIHQVGRIPRLTNLLTVLSYNTNDRRLNNTCNLKQSAIIKGVFINSLMQYSKSSIIA